MTADSGSNENRIDDALAASAHFRIAALLRRQGITVGARIPSESELGRQLGIGRQQVREGLVVLQAFGVISGRQGARRIWRGLDVQALLEVQATLGTGGVPMLTELLEIRHALETSLLPTVALRLAPADLAELRELSAEMERAAATKQSFSKTDAQFHLRLFSILRNSILDNILYTFWSQYDAVVELISLDPAREIEVAKMHTRIVNALAAGDQRLAVHELDTHFFGVREYLAAR